MLMHERLTRENLHSVWAAIATPFDEDDRFDEARFRENLRRLHAAGVHGIYTTDSDGEFYAIELDEFKRIVDVFDDTAACLYGGQRDTAGPRKPACHRQ